MSAERINNGITLWSKRGALVLLGWVGGSAYHSTATLTQKAEKLATVQAVEIPRLKAAVRCEDKRADRATDVAGKALIAANVEGQPVPKFRDIPEDNCPHPAGK